MVRGIDATLFMFAPEDIGAQTAVEEWMLEKAKSFGGDRSEAGRYAANIRWQNHASSETSADSWSATTEGGKHLVRLADGKGQTYETQVFLEPTLWIKDGDQPTSWEKREGPLELAEKVTAAEAMRVYETHPHLEWDANLQMQLDQLRTLPPEQEVRLALEVTSANMRWTGAAPVRPDEPHDVEDTTVLYGEVPWGDGRVDVRREALSKLVVNTSPPNVRDVSGSLRRWEEPYENDPTGQPYVTIIAKFAAAMTGDAPPPQEPWSGFSDRVPKNSHPSMEMLQRDAKVLVQTLNDNPAEQPVLWRGFAASSEAKEVIASAEEGDTFRMGLASASRDFRAAAKYSRSQDGGDTPIIMRIEAGSRGIQFGDKAIYVQDQEVVTGGEFEVVSRELVTVPKGAFAWNPFGTMPNWTLPAAKAWRAGVEQFKTVLTPKQYQAAVKKADASVERADKRDAETLEVEVMTVRQVSTYDPAKKRWNAND